MKLNKQSSQQVFSGQMHYNLAANKKNTLFHRSHFFAMTAMLMLSACDMYAPPKLNETKIQVAEEGITQNFIASDLTEDMLASLAQEYNDRSGSPLDLVVTYDPLSRKNTAMIAGDRAAGMARSLRSYGVAEINSSILPIKDQGDEGRVMISYRAVAALAPEGCEDMAGLNGNLVEPNPDYKLGCGVDTLMAKQIARPSDLLGRSSSDPTTDGRSTANVIDVYRTGAPNKPLDGEQASDKN